MFWHEYVKIPRHTSQNAITEGDFLCILARNCEGTEQLRKFISIMAILSMQEFREKMRSGQEKGKKICSFDGCTEKWTHRETQEAQTGNDVYQILMLLKKKLQNIEIW